MKKNEKDMNATQQKMKQHPVIYWLTVMTLIIIVVAFVIVPSTTGLMSSRTDSALGYFEGKKIANDGYSLYRSNLSAMEMNLRNSMPAEQFDMYYQYYASTIKNSTIENYAVVKMLNDNGIKVSPSKIEDLLRQQCGDFGIGAVYVVDTSQNFGPANFSEHLYKIDRSKNNLRVKAARRNLAYREAASVFFSDMNALGTFSDNEKAFLNKMAGNSAAAEYFEVTDGMIDTEELALYVEANSDDFRTLSIQMLRADNKATAKEIAQELADDPELFTERAKVYNSTMRARDEGRMEGFAADIARKLNVTKDSTLKKITALDEGEISDILPIDGYFYIFKADAFAVEADADEIALSQVNELVNMIKLDEPELYRELMDGAAEAIVAKSRTEGFSTTASLYAAEVKKMESFPLNYGNASMLTGINPTQYSNDESFLSEVFSAEAGEVINPVSSGMDLMIFKVTERTEDTAAEANINENSIHNAMFSDYINDPSRLAVSQNG